MKLPPKLLKGFRLQCTRAAEKPTTMDDGRRTTMDMPASTPTSYTKGNILSLKEWVPIRYSVVIVTSVTTTIPIPVQIMLATPAAAAAAEAAAGGGVELVFSSGRRAMLGKTVSLVHHSYAFSTREDVYILFDILDRCSYLSDQKNIAASRVGVLVLVASSSR